MTKLNRKNKWHSDLEKEKVEKICQREDSLFCAQQQLHVGYLKQLSRYNAWYKGKPM